MAENLTATQWEAVERDAADLCVTAGAGSGKTRVLVERFVHLVMEKSVPVERILAITFTDKAAAEMKERIAGEFERRGQEELRRQVEFAYLSTIDSFCARILRENALEAEVDPRFAVLEEFDADRLLEDAADEVLLARPEGKMTELLEATEIPDLPRALCALYREVRASGKPPEPATLEPPSAGAAAPAALRAAVEEVRRAMRAEELTPLQAEKGRAQLHLAEEVETIPRSATVAQIAGVFAGFRARIDLKGVNRPLFGAAMAGVREALKQCLAERLEEKVRPLRALMGELLGQLDAAYEERKRTAAVLDFADLEWKARRLLSGSPPVRRRLAEKFAHIFLDEFQDTNPLQKEIVDLLHQGNCLFAAGDAKQSIYGFRDADVGIIARFRSRLEPAGGHVALPDNFRSRPEIIALTNRLFSSDLWRSGEVPFERMTPGSEFAGKEIPSIEFLLVAGEKAEDGRQAEAEALAGRIVEMVEGEEAVFTRRGAEAIGAPLAYGDIAILLRSTTAMRFYERALAGRQVPYFAQKGRGYFQTQEVRDLVNLIRVLDNPRDDYRLAAVLRSPICGLSDDDVYRLCRRAPGTPPMRLAERIRSGEAELPEAGRRRLQVFTKLLDRLRERRGQGPLWMALQGVLSESPLAEAALLHFDGRRRFANLRKLVDLVRSWEAQGETSLPELVERLEATSGPEVRESEAAVETIEDDTVKLMTIHAAKGLEFPVVVLADLSREKKADPHREIFRRGLGLGIPLSDPENRGRGLHSTSYRALREAQEEAEEQEENRLLYVAMTRAQEHLMLSGWRKQGKAPPRSWLQAILDGLGGEGAIRADATVLWRSGTATAPAPGRRSSLRESHREGLQDLLPIPATPEILAAGPPAEEILRRIGLPLPAPDASPYLATVTEIVQHHLCPRRYHLRYQIGAPAAEFPRGGDLHGDGDPAEARDDEVPAEVLGDRVHRILAEGPNTPLANELLATLSPKDQKDAARQVRTFWESRPGRDAAQGSALREVPFALARSGATLRGQIDLILRGQDGSLRLIDYKTSRIEKHEVEEKAADYELQLRIYALAVRDLFGSLPGSASLYFLHPDVIHEVDLSPASLRAAEEAILAFFHAHRSASYPQSPARHCFACGYRRAYCANLTPEEIAARRE